MPKFLEDRLEASAAKAGKTGKAADRYVFGAMNNMGAMHGSKETPRGAAMQKKHDAKMGGKKKGFAAKLGAQLKEAY